MKQFRLVGSAEIRQFLGGQSHEASSAKDSEKMSHKLMKICTNSINFIFDDHLETATMIHSVQVKLSSYYHILKLRCPISIRIKVL